MISCLLSPLYTGIRLQPIDLSFFILYGVNSVSKLKAQTSENYIFFYPAYNTFKSIAPLIISVYLLHRPISPSQNEDLSYAFSCEIALIECSSIRALRSVFKNLDLECFPSITSRSNDIGYEIKNDMYIKPFVKGATVAAIFI